jgi:hypothetical protein
MTIVLTERDLDVRGRLTRAIARTGVAPRTADLAQEMQVDAADVEASLVNLANAKALLLHPGTARPWVVHPFALSPGSCWVQTNEIGYWANCLYCACGICALANKNAQIFTRYGGESETAIFEFRHGTLIDNGAVFHLSTPVARWWDNVVYACASFQPFRSRDDVSAWCERHDMPQGEILSLPRLWSFAKDWYGDYLKTPWHKRSAAETEALFARHGLTGPFWSLT